jgi:hypothetical protein
MLTNSLLKNITVLFIFTISSFVCFGQNISEIIKLVASDRATGDEFGRSVDILGNQAVVGAIYEENDLNGGSTLSKAGSAYIYENVDGTWRQTQKLLPNTRHANAMFGSSVAIHDDYVVIGAPGDPTNISGGDYKALAGAVYVYIRSVNNWVLVDKIVAPDRISDDHFGKSIDLTSQGLIVSSLSSYDENGTNYIQRAGAVYLYEKIANGLFNYTQKIVASHRSNNSHFGYRVSLTSDYGIISVSSDDLDEQGGNSVNDAGSVYFIKNYSGTWGITQKICAPFRSQDDYFGISVAMDGNYAVVGADGEDHDQNNSNSLPEAGSAFIYENNNGAWSLQQKINPNDRSSLALFGWDVDIKNDKILVSAPHESTDENSMNSINRAGSAYLFELNNGTWSQSQKIVAANRAPEDNFGSYVAMDGDNVLMGTYKEDQDHNNANTMLSSGAAYLFSCSSYTIENTSSCYSYTWSQNGETYHNTGRYYDTLTNAAGCDSISILNLEIQTTYQVLTLEVCEEYTVPSGDETYTNSGIYNDTLMNAAGCDSIISINLTILNSSRSTINASQCRGSYTSPSGNNTYTSSGTYFDTLVNMSGCDSIIEISLTIYPTYYFYDTVEVCNSYIWPLNGQTLKNTGSYTLYGLSNLGCDSNYYLRLIVRPVNSDVTYVDSTIKALATGAQYQWLICEGQDVYTPISGETTRFFTPVVSGSYAVEVFENNCSEISQCINVNISTAGIEPGENASIKVYPNPAKDMFTISGLNYDSKITLFSIEGKKVLETETSEKNVELRIDNSPSGTYLLQIEQNGQLYRQKLIIQ